MKSVIVNREEKRVEVEEVFPRLVIGLNGVYLVTGRDGSGAFVGTCIHGVGGYPRALGDHSDTLANDLPDFTGTIQLSND